MSHDIEKEKVALNRVCTFVEVVAFPDVLQIASEPMFEEVDSSAHGLKDRQLDDSLATDYPLHGGLEPA